MATDLATEGRARDSSRARLPAREGFVERDGVRVFYEVYGSGEPTILLLPSWSIAHSRLWKMQIPYLSRHARVVTFDGRGNGRSDRPAGEEAYRESEFAADALAVLDTTGTESAILIGASYGARWATHLAADHPQRVEGIVCLAPAVSLAPPDPAEAHFFEDEPETDRGWAKFNRHFWTRSYREFVEFFFSKCFNEPHSTRQIEDGVAWGLETTPQVLTDSTRGVRASGVSEFLSACDRLKCRALVIHGSEDAVRPHASGAGFADRIRAPLVTLDGSGHLPNARDPVKVNLLLRDFACPPPQGRTWTRGRGRRKRALFVSSPIGLGHAQRDAAIADELRRLHPDLVIDWLAQHPVTTLLEARGERVHPLSAELASESGHIECESAEHDLHVFQAWRRMDEILLSNFMVFHDVVRD